jgi:predicted membrane channel-forming protein YqfA (hemolysin III family)
MTNMLVYIIFGWLIILTAAILIRTLDLQYQIDNCKRKIGMLYDTKSDKGVR